MFLDILAVLILLVILTLPVGAYLFDRYGFEEADHHGKLKL